MRRHSSLTLLFVIMAIALFAVPAFSGEDDSVEAPLSPQYLEWLSQRQSGDTRPGGHIPFPADLSHLADNPPDESLLGTWGRNKDGEIPSTYDLRSVGGKSYVTSIKNQNPYGTCWAHAAIGAMESNFLMQGGDILDLSEMHLAYFTFINADKSKAFDNITLNGRNYRSESLSSLLDEGGHSFFPAALYSRLDGPVLESEVPYPARPSSNNPADYTRVLRLREVYYLNFENAIVNVNASETQRNIVKRRIMNTGAVVANYWDADEGYSSNMHAYYRRSSSTATNHAVQIIGWDDNYLSSNFKTNPGMNGAWLIKNSWGANFADNGYMWISYANYLNEGSAFIVEKPNPQMKAYCNDPLGWTGGQRGWGGPDVYIANAFKSERAGEVLTEVGFYTFDNNQNYEVRVYTGLGATMPSSPVSGTQAAAATTSGTIPFAGYHTVTLSSPVALTQNQYFSVVLKYTGKAMAPTSSKIAGMSDNFSLRDGSFFSQNGSSWTKGSEWKVNAPLKAFTIVGGEDGSLPQIVTSSLASAVMNSSYTAMLSAYGEYPITWSLASGSSLPDGLSLNSSMGMISGTPTTKGSYTFTVIATNENGTDSKTLSLTVSDVPEITTTSFTGYVGYDMPDAKLELSNGASAKWSVTGDLPKKLSLNASTGEITGKPKTAGTYSVTVNAETAAGTSTGIVTFTINEKPVKATIKTSSLTPVTVYETVNQALQLTGTEPITINVIEGMPEGMAFDYTTNSFTGSPVKSGKYSIKLEVSNIVNSLTGKDPAGKKVKLTVNGITPKINAPEELPSGILGRKYPGYTVDYDGSAPEKWTASGLPKGLSIDASGYIGGIPQKSGAFGVKITAKNNAGKDATDKIPLVIYAKPEIRTKKLKDGTTDKAYSVKLSIKNEPETVNISGNPSTLALSKDEKGNYTLNGTPVEAGSYKVYIYAENPAGSSDVTLPLVIKGVAPKLKVSLPKGTTGAEYSGTITITGSKPMTISCDILAADAKKFGIASLDELGLTFSANASTGIITVSGTPKYSVKGLPVYITAKNSVGSITKAVKLKISGTKPSFTKPSGDTLTFAARQAFSIDIEVSGSEKMTFTLKGANGFKLTQTGGLTAWLTGTAPAAGSNVKLTITAQNADGKASKKITIEGQANGSSRNNSADEESDNALSDELDGQESDQAHEEAESEAQVITFGNVRDVSGLTRSERERLELSGYEIAAVLPEVSVDVSGMYDLEAELDEDVRTGAEMIWLAFPRNADESEDDGIAEFFDEDGQEITEVPESHSVKVSVWLNEGVIYAPVIAVK